MTLQSSGGWAHGGTSTVKSPQNFDTQPPNHTIEILITAYIPLNFTISLLNPPVHPDVIFQLWVEPEYPGF